MALDDKTLFRVFRNGGLTRQVSQALIDRFASGGSSSAEFVAYLNPGFDGCDPPQFIFTDTRLAADSPYATRQTWMLPYAAGVTIGVEVDQVSGAAVTHIGATSGMYLSVQRISDATGALAATTASSITVDGTTPVNAPAVFDPATAALYDGITVASDNSGLITAVHGLYLVEISMA